MRYLALASDYDGTLARFGSVDGATIDALEWLNHSGRKLILVTGRALDDLKSVFTRMDLCALAVVDNGAVLYDPFTDQKRILAHRPPERFADSLRKKGAPVSVGDAIVATPRSYEREAAEAIRESGLDLHIIFNKDAIMILPSGVDKLTGLNWALQELGIPLDNVVGIGDGENDRAFMTACGLSVAVANAVPELIEIADLVTEGERGAGVVEAIERVMRDDHLQAGGRVRR